ncbi:MAG TPA: FtsX-like permease family protein [Segeticoccus sp.]|uniref:ABC transporter permease n=1 Tax=Segeticoccus sp. TaxID=2706531 RepID=UPI002D7E3F76|nr:FtsX-like permease family protein [Segeticoccus sp.]HET8598871.1 FtsX-like permease family protein [Segeticoccus sp.]
MLRLSLKQVLRHRFRLALTLVAIVLGVTFVAGSLVLTDTSQRLFDEQFATQSSGVDVTVQSAVAFDSAMGVQVDREPLPTTVLGTVRDTAGVGTAYPVATGRGLIQVGGTAIAPSGPSLLRSWTDGPTNPYRLRQGRAPSAAGEVVLDAVTARDHGIALGDTVRIQAVRTQPLTVVGLAGFGDQPGIPDSTAALTTLGQAQRLLGLGHQVSEVQVTAANGSTAAEVRSRLADALGPRYAATSSRDTAAAGVAAAADRLSYLRVLLLALAGAALLVGGYLIANTFAIVLSQRTRELALLRAAGATGGQVFGTVFGEALILGVVGSALGTGLGVGAALGLRDLIGRFGVALPDGSLAVLPTSLLTAFAVGVVTTVLAAVGPSRRAARVSPLEAMRTADAPLATGRLRRVVGVLAATLAVAGALAALTGWGDALTVGLSGVLALLALALLGPVLLPALARQVGRPLRALGVPGRLAGELAARAPRRTAATVLGLGLSLALMSFMVVLGGSVKQSIAAGYQEVVTADFVVESARAEMLGGLPPAVRGRVASLPGVAATSPVRYGHWKDRGRVSALTAVDPATIGAVVSARMDAGSLRDLSHGGLVLARHVATERGLEVGDRLPMTFAKTGNRSLRVVGLMNDGDARALSTDFIIGMETFDRLFTERVDASVYVALAEGTSSAAAQQVIHRALKPYPTAVLRDQDDAVQARAGAVDQILGLVTVLLAFTVLIALLGIANTLALSIVERTREIGLLRAIGMTRAQVRRMVCAEAVLVAALAVVVGLVVGVTLGAAATVALGSDPEASVVVPVGRLAVVTVLAVAAGFLAGLLPARRAARLRELEAIGAA